MTEKEKNDILSIEIKSLVQQAMVHVQRRPPEMTPTDGRPQHIDYLTLLSATLCEMIRAATMKCMAEADLHAPVYLNDVVVGAVLEERELLLALDLIEESARNMRKQIAV